MKERDLKVDTAEVINEGSIIEEHLKTMTLEEMTKVGTLWFYQREGDSLEVYKEQLRSEGLQGFFSDFFGQGIKAIAIDEDEDWNFEIRTSWNCDLHVYIDTMLDRLEQYLIRMGLEVKFSDVHYLRKTQCNYLTMTYKKGKEIKEVTFEECKFLTIIYKVLDIVDFRGLSPVIRPSRIEEITKVEFS